MGPEVWRCGCAGCFLPLIAADWQCLPNPEQRNRADLDRSLRGQLQTETKIMRIWGNFSLFSSSLGTSKINLAANVTAEDGQKKEDANKKIHYRMCVAVFLNGNYLGMKSRGISHRKMSLKTWNIGWKWCDFWMEIWRCDKSEEGKFHPDTVRITTSVDQGCSYILAQFKILSPMLLEWLKSSDGLSRQSSCSICFESLLSVDD